MRTTLKALVVGGISFSLASPVLAHPRIDLHLDAIISASGTPQSEPIITFENFTNGTAGVMATISGMQGAEFLNALAFNFGGAGTPSFNHVSGAEATVSFDRNDVTLGPVAKGGAGFDVLFDYPNAQADRFDGSFLNSVYTITGAGVDENDFNVTNASGLFAMAHIGSIGANGQASAFVGAQGDFVAPIPEAEVYAMMLAGLGLLGFVMSRRRRSVVPAI